MLSMIISVGALGVFSGPVNIFFVSGVFFFLVPLVVLGSAGEVVCDLGMETFLGIPLVVLTLWVGGLSCIVSPHTKRLRKHYKGCVTLLVFLLVFSFSVVNGVGFYMAFEGSLVPISYLMLFWGHNPERVEAVMYLVVYTMVGGSLHMVALVMMDLFLGSTSFVSVYCISVSGGGEFILWVWWVCLVIPFFIKAPCYGFHLWLPKAHVEAPVSGSMLLAAIMLKLGVYGIFLYSGIFYVPLVWAKAIQVMGIWGGVMSSFVAIRQVDLKGVIAYASVGHMSFSFSSVFSYSMSGTQGVMFLMVSHGLASSGLFAWAGVVYSKFGTRNLVILSGLRVYSPGQAVILLGLLMANSGIPPFVSFLGEMLIFSSLFLLGGWVALVLIISVVLEMVYSSFLFILSQHSGFMAGSSGALGIQDREWLVFLGHFLPLVMLFFWSSGLAI